MSNPMRVANISGFYGDRIDAAREIVEGGPVDVLTGDYLAELTMLILWKAREKDPTAGYAVTFLRQMEQVLGTCLDRGIRIVTNAGGLNPGGLAERLTRLANELGLNPRVAYVEGDDLLDRIGALQSDGIDFANLDTGQTLERSGLEPVSANAYLGAWGITDALHDGADVVVCPRVTDASVVVGPAAWWHGWGRQDWNQLAGAVVAGHVIECGPQATGGNYSFLREITDRRYPGFPIAEIESDGSSVITKHDGTGGLVSVGTVTSQLLYEIGPPAYLNPDVTTHFDTITLDQEGDDRVRMQGIRGTPPTDQLKVALNAFGGYRNTMTMVFTGLDIDEKAAWAQETIFELLGGEDSFDEVDVRLIRSDKPDASTNEEATAQLRVTVKDRDARKVGRRFSNTFMELALANYAGFHTTTPPSSESAFGVYWPALVPASVVEHVVVLSDGSRSTVPHTTPTDGEDPTVPGTCHDPPPERSWGRTTRGPLGTICGARSGDKGGNANVGVWCRSDAAYAWLYHHLDVELFRQLVPEARDLDVQRYDLPNLRALNFVVVGILGSGVAASPRPDPQAKGLGEYLRSRFVDIPAELLSDGMLVQT
jgi:hypothetical protein